MDRERFLNRELSWLDFNERVLALAERPAVPLLERVNFLSIFWSNLDEFFQVRVAGLKDQVAAGIDKPTSDGRSPRQQLVEIRAQVGELVAAADAILHDHLVPELADEGINFVTYDELDEHAAKLMEEEFHHRIFPILTPLAFDPSHPFPYLSDLSLNLAVFLHDPVERIERFARVKIPSLLPRVIAVPDDDRVLLIEDVVAAHLDLLFPGMKVSSHHLFRVTRNADLILEDEEADDLLAAVELELRRRRFGKAVRLEVTHDMTDAALDLLLRELELDERDVFVSAGPIGVDGLNVLGRMPRPDLKYESWPPVTQRRLSDEDGSPDIFAEIAKGDILLHHPYCSFATSVEAFIEAAADDPDVQAIKMTLYRTAESSPIVQSLIRAAEAGKQVAVLIELRARFDEAANIHWARQLEQAGVHVGYGVAGIKIHAKTVLVVRRERDAIRTYCHVGTGNYNYKTARIYEDLGLLTADPVIGDDLVRLMNSLTGFARHVEYEKLIVSPEHTRPRLLELIHNERKAGPDAGRIILKTNSLVDPEIIDALYEASTDGIQIDLIVRGICCLRPGVVGRSEHIRVRSIVGRHLEHSRIYYFGNGAEPGVPAIYIGSPDLMQRNLDRRVEALVPIEELSLQARIAEQLVICFSDDDLAWTLDADGVWTKVPPVRGVNAHADLRRRTVERARHTSGD